MSIPPRPPRPDTPPAIETMQQDRGRIARWWARQHRRIAGLHDMPGRWALRAANTAPVRRLLGARYHAAIARHRVNLSALNLIDNAIVRQLRTTGVFITSLDALALDGSIALIIAAQAAALSFADEARRRVRAGSDFNVVPSAAILAAPEIFSWGLSQRLLAIAESYLELPVGYDGVSVNYTVADGREVSTRKWHRDWEDRRMLKVAIYLNDVDADGGPFEMVSRADAMQHDRTGFFYGLAGDAELEARLGPDFRRDIVSCTGGTGTVIFTDTAGYFHRGKPATARDRAALFYSYFARSPRHPFLCERSGLSRSDIAHLANDLAPAQRAAVDWRRTVPLALRMIPSARI